MSGALNDLPDWPPETAGIVQSVRSILARGARRGPSPLARMRKHIDTRHMSVTDRDIVQFLAEMAVTLPPLKTIHPEYRKHTKIRAAVEAINLLSAS